MKKGMRFWIVTIIALAAFIWLCNSMGIFTLPDVKGIDVPGVNDYCDGGTSTIKPVCDSNSDCSGSTPYCGTYTRPDRDPTRCTYKGCVQCLTNDQCSSGLTCLSGTCKSSYQID